jgi:hypothetical protein
MNEPLSNTEMQPLGKATVFHSMLPEISACYARIYHWKMEPSNNQHFASFIERCVEDINRLERDARDCLITGRTLILIGNIHYLQNIRESYGMNSMTALLSTVRRAFHCRDRLRVLMFSDGLPNMFGEEFGSLVDDKCLMPMFTTEERRSFFLDHMRTFHNALTAGKLEGFDGVTFSIHTDREDNEEPGFEEPYDADPDHIINTLTGNSACCTPADMLRFLQRTIKACYRHKVNDGEDGSDYNEDLVVKLHYPLEGRPSITPFNPLTRMEKFEQFYRQELESARRQLGVRDLRPDRVSDTRIGKAVIGKHGIDIKLPPGAPAAPEQENEDDDGDEGDSRKRSRTNEEGEEEEDQIEGAPTPPVRRLKKEEIIERLEVMSNNTVDHFKAERRRKKDADRVKERTRHLRGQQEADQ